MGGAKTKDGLTICSMCGKPYLRPRGTIYSVKFAGRENNCCSYKCYRTAQKLKEELNSAAYARDLRDVVKSSDLHQIS